MQATVDELRRQTDEEARQTRELDTKQRQARDKFLSDERQAQMEAKRQADSYARNKKALQQEIAQLNAAIVAAAAERDARAEKIRSRLDNRLESKAVSLNASTELRGVVDKVMANVGVGVGIGVVIISPCCCHNVSIGGQCRTSTWMCLCVFSRCFDRDDCHVVCPA